MADLFAAVNSDTKRFPAVVRQQLAAEVADQSTEVGASLSATYGLFESVRKFGVKGDGTDETTAIQAAINGFSGGTLFFPKGTYTFHTLDLTSSNVVLVGEGDGTVLLSTYLKTDLHPAIRWIGSNVGVRHLKLQAQVVIPPEAGLSSYELLKIGGDGTQFESGVLIDDVTFVDGGGCNAYRTSDVAILNNRYTGSHGNSFGCVEVVADVQILGNTATDGNDDLIAITCDSNVPGGTKRVIIDSNNLARSDGKAIGTSGIASGVITGNHIEDTYAPGIQAFTDATYGLQPSAKLIIVGNLIQRGGQWFGADKMHTAVGTAGHGIYISGDDISVIENKVLNSALHGITGATLTRFKVANNEVTTAGLSGIWLGGDNGTAGYATLVDGDVTMNRVSGVQNGVVLGQGTRINVGGNNVSGWSGAGETRAMFVGYLQDSQVYDNLLVNTLAGSYGLRVRPGTVNPQMRTWNNPTIVPGDDAGSGAILTLDRKITFASAAPTSGKWGQGDIAFNVAAANSGATPMGWVCTASGSPGTWVSLPPLNILLLANTWGAAQTFNSSVTVAGALTANGNVKLADAGADTVGFYGSNGTAKPTVSGSQGGNAALASLITALAGLGLFNNSTTA